MEFSIANLVSNQLDFNKKTEPSTKKKSNKHSSFWLTSALTINTNPYQDLIKTKIHGQTDKLIYIKGVLNNSFLSLQFGRICFSGGFS